MRSSDRALAFACTVVALAAMTTRAEAQQGFAVERFYPSAPGGGWLVMDDLSEHGGFGGAISVSGGYASDPLRVANGAQSLAVVSNEAFADIGLAATYDRFRLYLNFTSPLVVAGDSGDVGPYHFTGPSADLGKLPDLISDARIGFDARIYGEPGSAFRFGAGGQLFVPNGARADYDTDDTVRAMFRLLLAGDAKWFTWAAHVGVHVRPLDDSPAPASAMGSELLFGAAAGARFTLGEKKTTAIVIGPEVYGETALRDFFGAATGVEGLLGARVEGRGDDGPQVRAKLGAGVGLDPQFGAPAWRFVFSIELFTRSPTHERKSGL